MLIVSAKNRCCTLKPSFVYNVSANVPSTPALPDRQTYKPPPAPPDRQTYQPPPARQTVMDMSLLGALR